MRVRDGSLGGGMVDTEAKREKGVMNSVSQLKDTQSEMVRRITPAAPVTHPPTQSMQMSYHTNLRLPTFALRYATCSTWFSLGPGQMCSFLLDVRRERVDAVSSFLLVHEPFCFKGFALFHVLHAHRAFPAAEFKPQHR